MAYVYLPYIVTEGFCILFCLTILFRLNVNIGTQHQVQMLRAMIYAFLGMLCADMLWALYEDNFLPLCPPVQLVDSVLLVSSLSMGCYFWFRYVEDRLSLARHTSRRYTILTRLPLYCICTLDILSVFTGWLFVLDEGGHYNSTNLFFIQTAVNYYYLLVPTIAALSRARRALSRQDRQEYTIYAGYMLSPLLGGLLEGFLPTVPILALSIFLVIHILFLLVQNLQVNNDALTGLNNRRRMTQYLEEILPKASKKSPVMVVMMDMNGFKLVNDRYGHTVGDRALALFGKVLQAAAARHEAFAARYGGDEFCLIVTDARCNAEMLTLDIEMLLQATQKQESPLLPCTLTVSVGTTVCDTPTRDIEAVLHRADESLYQNKRAWHSRMDALQDAAR